MVVEDGPTIKHNWLYSVVPLFPTTHFSGAPYLAGYCKQCRNGFTVRMGVESAGKVGAVYMKKLDIPLYGCEPVD